MSIAAIFKMLQKISKLVKRFHLKEFYSILFFTELILVVVDCDFKKVRQESWLRNERAIYFVSLKKFVKKFSLLSGI